MRTIPMFNERIRSIGVITIFSAMSVSMAIAEDAEEILDASGVQGGLVVSVGCSDADRLAALGKHRTVLVHGLDPNAQKVDVVRKVIRSQDLYGRVSVERWTPPRLPYADNLVNLIIVDDPASVSMEELMRVLAPDGVACVRRAGKWTQTVKPRPEGMDDWTHYLCGADGNPVADDDRVGPPQQLQWMASPSWARHHEHMASMNALVASQGRIFSLCDEGPNRSMLHPPRWTLSARDAFNGLRLWKRPIEKWFSHLHPLKSGPASLPRRLVAQGEHVYVTMGIDAPVSVLDAATGETVRVLQGTERTQEIVLSEGILFLVRGEGETDTKLTAVDPATGKILWHMERKVVTLTLAADRERVVFYDGERVVSLDRNDGTEQWATNQPIEKRRAGWRDKTAPRLILTNEAVVVAPKASMFAFSCEDGKLLWSAPHPHSGYASPKDLFVIDNLVWYGDTAGADNTGRFEGRDILTGEIKRSFEPDVDIVWLSHHRCHISKATRKYILPARMGVEFVDLKKEVWKEHHWIRGGCLYGVMPCNGLLYTPPHACACYFEAKMNGFAAYSSGTTPPDDTNRLEKGPAYGEDESPQPESSAADWPVFRHDAARSGDTPSFVEPEVGPLWSVEIGGKLTQPVVAGGTLYVAAVDGHALHALDAESGERKWEFLAAGRIDSPPSVHHGRVLFGSRDGWVYCLRSRDGRMVWRYRAAPADRRIMVQEQLESAWPVHGSVLIENGEVHCVAGRNMFLDGGLRYLRLDPVAGKRISETVMDRTDPIRGGTIQKYDSWLDMTTTLPDVLSSDGTNIYMRSLPFDTQGQRRRVTHIADPSEPAHLFSPTGFLDDQWFHRSYWTYARIFPGGWIGHLNAGRYNPSGRLLVLDDAAIYGFGRKPEYYKWTTALEYRLFAVDRTSFVPRDIYAFDRFKARQLPKFPEMKIDKQLGLPSGPRANLKESYDCFWKLDKMPILVAAMVGTKETLFVAGPKDISNEDLLWHRNAAAGYDAKRKHLAEQDELWRSGKGGTLLALSKAAGKTIAQYTLDSSPVFDGLIAANGRLYLSLGSGEVTCLGKKK